MIKRKLNKKYNDILRNAIYPFEDPNSNAFPWIYTLSAVMDLYKRFPVNTVCSHVKEKSTFTPLIIPFIRLSVLKLHEAKVYYDSLNSQCKEKLENHLAERLSSIISPLMNQVCDEKYNNDINICINKSYKSPLSIFKEYPVVARLLSEQTGYWIASVKHLISRLLSDIQELNNVFFDDDNSYTDAEVVKSISEIDIGLSDPHEKGETVAVIGFNNGRKLVYKPKSVLSEKKMSVFLSWFNERSENISLKSVEVIDKGKYGWEKFICHYPCESDKDISLFYQKAGAQAALLYILRGMDYHHDNLIASGEDPVFIDHEMLFYPIFIHPENKEADNKSISEIQSGYYESVLNTRMFPIKEKRVNGDISDVSAIGYFSENKDNLHIPCLKEKSINAKEYKKDIVEGFSFAYKLIMQYKNELLNEEKSPLSYFDNALFRFNVRATSSYLSINNLCLSPDAMKSGLGFCTGIHSIRKNMVSIFGNAFPSKLGNEELRILTRLDVPRFSVRINSKDLFSEGHCFKDILRYSGKELVIQRIKNLSDVDLCRQIEYIEGSLSV